QCRVPSPSFSMRRSEKEQIREAEDRRARLAVSLLAYHFDFLLRKKLKLPEGDLGLSLNTPLSLSELKKLIFRQDWRDFADNSSSKVFFSSSKIESRRSTMNFGPVG